MFAHTTGLDPLLSATARADKVMQPSPRCRCVHRARRTQRPTGATGLPLILKTTGHALAECPIRCFWRVVQLARHLMNLLVRCQRSDASMKEIPLTSESSDIPAS
jgi:hypothetical protein